MRRVLCCGLMLAAVVMVGLGSCASTSKLYVTNDTDRAFALRIDSSQDAYRIAPAEKYAIPARLPRGRAHQLTAMDDSGNKSVHHIMTDAPQLFIQLREAGSGQLEWWTGRTPPSPAADHSDSSRLAGQEQ